ncbi:hypothetical protein G5I_09017 [Acromyrmex echinatior]|uniref:Uncharacterized protein n=1 Tax=Acromyrmex echinatior TaxID=103372 RepID=F4WT42_ACREC|nr:hypothetical protein G5I_09017 [Acromyrmex echinatior]
MQRGVSPAIATETREKEEKDTETLGVTYTKAEARARTWRRGGEMIRNDRTQTTNAVEDVQREEEEEEEEEEGKREQLWPTAQRRLLCSGIRNTKYEIRNTKYAIGTSIANRDPYSRAVSRSRRNALARANIRRGRTEELLLGLWTSHRAGRNDSPPSHLARLSLALCSFVANIISEDGKRELVRRQKCDRKRVKRERARERHSTRNGSGDSTGRRQRAMPMTATMTHVYAVICGKEGISRSANQPRCQPIGCFTSHLCGNLYRNATALLAGRSSTDSRSA